MHTLQVTSFLILIAFSQFYDITCSSQVLFKSFPENVFVVSKEQPHILIVWSGLSGGVPKLLLTLYKSLLITGVNVSILVERNSYLERELKQARLPYFSACFGSWTTKNVNGKKMPMFKTNEKLITAALKYICHNNNIHIVHVNRPVEITAALKVAAIFGFVVVAQEHYYQIKNPFVFKGVSALTATSPEVAQTMKIMNKKLDLGIQLCKFIPPLADEISFSDYVSQYQSKSDYFKQNFDFDVGNNEPVVCMIANFLPCKNHKCLINATAKLYHEDKFPIHVIFAGEGSATVISECKKMVHDWKIDKYVHFAGFVHDIPSLLYYSEAKILPSLGEAFSIAVMEAALMKKPIIVSSQVGAANTVVINEKTGLVFDPTNHFELATCIKKVIENKLYAKTLGENACSLVKKKFTLEVLTQQYLQFYLQVYYLIKNGNQSSVKRRERVNCR